MGYEQMELDVTLTCDRELKDNVGLAVELACRQIAAQNQKVVESNHEGYGTEDGEKGGIACRSFFTGRFNPVRMGVPMGSSVALVTKEMCEGNTELEYIVLNQTIGVLATRLEEITGGNSHGGN